MSNNASSDWPTEVCWTFAFRLTDRQAEQQPSMQLQWPWRSLCSVSPSADSKLGCNSLNTCLTTLWVGELWLVNSIEFRLTSNGGPLHLRHDSTIMSSDIEHHHEEEAMQRGSHHFHNGWSSLSHSTGLCHCFLHCINTWFTRQTLGFLVLLVPVTRSWSVVLVWS